ncbi:MAG: hypothetical protein DLM68_03590, partial [Hyphomicrobiales bacterium]
IKETQLPRFTFGGQSIVEVYKRPGVDEVAILGLGNMLGLATDVHARELTRREGVPFQRRLTLRGYDRLFSCVEPAA